MSSPPPVCIRFYPSSFSIFRDQRVLQALMSKASYLQLQLLLKNVSVEFISCGVKETKHNFPNHIISTCLVPKFFRIVGPAATVYRAISTKGISSTLYEIKQFTVFQNFLNCSQATCHLQMRIKRKTEYSFLMYKLFVTIEQLLIYLS